MNNIRTDYFHFTLLEAQLSIKMCDCSKEAKNFNKLS